MGPWEASVVLMFMGAAIAAFPGTPPRWKRVAVAIGVLLMLPMLFRLIAVAVFS